MAAQPALSTLTRRPQAHRAGDNLKLIAAVLVPTRLVFVAAHWLLLPETDDVDAGINDTAGQPAVIGSEWQLVLLAAAAALGARVLVVGGVGVALHGTRERLPARWLPVLAWGGLRGALSLVLALSLPDDVMNRPLIIAMTGGTVVVSLVFQGSTMPLVLRRLNVLQTPGATIPLD